MNVDTIWSKVESAQRLAQENSRSYAVLIVDDSDFERPVVVRESLIDDPEIAYFTTAIVAIINDDRSIVDGERELTDRIETICKLPNME